MQFYSHKCFPYISVFFSFASYLTSIAMMEDRLGGVWNRFTVAGVKPTQFLISHLSFGSCLMLIQSIEFLGFALYIAFDINLNYVVMVSLLLVLMGLTGVLYGLILSIITDNTLVSSIGSLLAMYPFLCLSGKNNLLLFRQS